MKPLRILFVGETRFVTMTEVQGLDQFSETNYRESALNLIHGLEQAGHSVTRIPTHLIPMLYPRTLDGLKEYDVVLFSDVGSNSFLLLPEVVRQGKRAVNLLKLTKQFVEEGGGFCMIGGYFTFQGKDGRGHWKNTDIETILPVQLQEGDDRCEMPQGCDLTCVPSSHPVLHGLPEKWPYILGYNKVYAKESGQAIISYEGDPIITCGSFGKGRVIAYATDCTSHWSPDAMCDWEYYPALWNNIVSWLASADN